jgi:putative glutamine amidotransferase
MRSKKPKIGITSSAEGRIARRRWPTRHAFDFLKRNYAQMIIRAGGVPLPLVNTRDRETIAEYLELMEGLLVTGGDDMNPRYFGQKPHKSIKMTAPERDEFELNIIKGSLKKGLPVLGICRGLQVINIALGGTLHQDLECVPRKILRHANPKEMWKVEHKVNIDKETLLYEIIGAARIGVKSSHHQVVDRPGRGLRISARSSDGIIEGLENPAYQFLVGVQWHPEMTPRRLHCRKLFDGFIRACR